MEKAPVELKILTESWKVILDELDHGRVKDFIETKELNPLDMKVEREDGHEMLLACRLLGADNLYSASENLKGKDYKDTEYKLDTEGKKKKRSSKKGELEIQEQEKVQEQEPGQEQEQEQEQEDDKVQEQEPGKEQEQGQQQQQQEQEQEQERSKEKVNTSLSQVEQRLKVLEERLGSCKMNSMAIYKDVLSQRLTIAHPVLLARDIPNKITGSSNDESLIMTISIYSTHRPGIRTQTFDVYTETLLTDLRDRLTCITDRIISRLHHSGPYPSLNLDNIENTSSNFSEPVQHGSHSAYFLIEGVFYSDMRYDDSIDFSADIREWIVADAARSNDMASINKMLQMEKVKWSDVPLRLNQPYSFVHCGRCDHYIVIERIRREHRYDRARVNSWAAQTDEISPIREIYRIRRRRRKCRICDVNRAVWITSNDRLVPDNPCSLCDTCYKSLHYDPFGKLLYNDFKVYPYFYEFH